VDATFSKKCFTRPRGFENINELRANAQKQPSRLNRRGQVGVTIMNDKYLSTAFAAVLFAMRLGATEPVPAFSSPGGNTSGEAPTGDLSAIDSGNFTIRFMAKFGRLPSTVSPFGIFDFSAEKDGKAKVIFRAPPTELLGDFTMTAASKVRKGEWHELVISYSRLTQRAVLYMDGVFQWENDNLHLPRVLLAERPAREGATGTFRDLEIYGAALSPEDVAVAGAEEVERRCGAALAATGEASAKAKCDGLKKWIADIAGRATSLQSAQGGTPRGRLRAVERDARNAARIAGDAASAPKEAGGAIGNSGALYTVPPLSQEPVIPYAVPECGVLSGEMRIMASPGEHESGSTVLQAFMPVKVNRVTAQGPFRADDGAALAPSVMDVKIVKRWFRSGLSWLSYHNDKGQRNLTPDLLMNDDGAIKVDEFAQRNFLRLDYPAELGGRIYVDVSDPEKGHTGWRNSVPFSDAKTLQPVSIPEAGRNQQFYFTFSIPADAKPGVYKGRVNFSIDRGDLSLAVVIRVLPIALPTEPSPYNRLDEVYISHMNSITPPEGATLAAREAFAREELANVHAHNLNHTTGIWTGKEMAALAYEAGFVPDYIFGSPFSKPPYWKTFYPGAKSDSLTADEREAGIRASIRAMRPWQKYFRETFPSNAIQYVIYHSESQRHITIAKDQAEEAEVARRLGQRVFAHGWDNNSRWSGDIQDMHASTAISAEEARRWRAAGADVINYADPFPGSENPLWFRRKVGLMMYKTGLDGQMLHGFRNGRTPWNEWAEDWGGDGNYRNFAICYPMRGGQIYSLSWEGMREAYDDVRYATRLQQLALANIDAEAVPLKREARRAMLWLERVDPATTDVDMVRTGIIDRILLLQDAIARHGGVTPDPDMALRVARGAPPALAAPKVPEKK
jgi:hypothetical protein